MRRIATIAGFIICLCAAFVFSLPFLLSSELVRGRILSHLTELTGTKVSFRGDPSVAFSPFLGIELSDLTVADPNSDHSEAMLLRVESVKAKLDLLPALIGDVRISEYQLVRPELRLVARKDGKSSWNFKSGALSEILESADTSNTATAETPVLVSTLGGFDIVDGTVRYIGSANAETHEIAGVSGKIDWQDTSSVLALTLDAVWRNENIQIDSTVEQPINVFAGGKSDISTQFASGPLSFNFSGQANMFSDLFVEGDFEATTPSINRLAEFLKTDLGTLRVIGAWTASGKINATLDTTLLTDATLQINENIATGVVRIANTESGGSKLDGTLAFDEIELSNYLEQANTAEDPIKNVTPANFDIDLRISANAINTGRFAMQNVAAAISSSGNGWQFDIANAEAFGGSLVAQITSETAESGTQLSLKFKTRSSDASTLKSIIGEQNWELVGEVDLRGDLRTQMGSTSLPELRFNGELEASSEDGSINGIDLPAVFSSIQEGSNGVVQKEAAQGETDFELLDLKVFLSNSIASISKASIVTEDAKIQLLGDADLTKGTLAIRAQRLNEEGPVPGRIIIGGTLDDPLVTIRSIPGAPDIHPD
nr:AsmA family protein [Rhizobiaceae bacterium]